MYFPNKPFVLFFFFILCFLPVPPSFPCFVSHIPLILSSIHLFILYFAIINYIGPFLFYYIPEKIHKNQHKSKPLLSLSILELLSIAAENYIYYIVIDCCD